MKRVLLPALALLLITNADAQNPGRTNVKESHDRFVNIEIQHATTTELPEGAVFNKGKVTLKKGYSTNYADSNRVIIIKKPNGEFSGAFTCSCEAGSSCPISYDSSVLKCLVTKGCNCKLDVVIKLPKNTAITQSGGNWKKLVVPAANTQRQNTEDPDQGGEIFKNGSRAASSTKQ